MIKFPLIDRLFSGSSRSVEPNHHCELIEQHEIRNPESLWKKIDLYADRSAKLPGHAFLSNQGHLTDDIRKAFGTKTPPAEQYLLHHGRNDNWRKKEHPFPIVLIHGAGRDATQSFNKLAPELNREGHAVFAITVPHNQWAIQSQCHQLGNAIQQVKTITESRAVNLIGHSMGGVVARMYVSELRESWMKPYADGEVKKLIICAAPLGGTDLLFRIPELNVVMQFNKEINFPMTWTAILKNGEFIETGGHSVLGGYYPAICQITYPWDGPDPISSKHKELYHTYYGTGEDGALPFRAPGIRQTMDAGRNFIRALQDHPVPDNVEVHLMAGIKPLPDVPEDAFKKIENDGLIPVESALLHHRSERVKTKAVLPLNHCDSIDFPEGIQVIKEALATSA